MIFRQISQVRTWNNFQFLIYNGACSLWIKKAPKEEKHLINMVCVTLEGLWIISDRIVDFRFFVKFHRSGLAIFLSSWAITEHVLYASKKFLIKEMTRSTWWVFLWKYYGWFLLELLIFDFSSNFTDPDMQHSSVFEL